MDFGTTPVEELREALKRNEELLSAAQSPLAEILRTQIGNRRDQTIAMLIHKDDFATVHFLRGCLHILDEVSRIVDPAVISHSSEEILAQIDALRRDL